MKVHYRCHHLVLFGICMLTMAIAFGGCGGGSADPSAADTTEDTERSGELAVSLTDAAGDFASYTVDVLSLTLTRANGAKVSTLPWPARVDFAQYTDMTEFLTAARVPLGAYVAATMTLDYSNADIWVENESGALERAESIVDENGQPVSVIEVTVQLEGRNHLTIAPGMARHLLLDFDLKATNQVAFDDQGTPRVTVDPYLVADVDRTESKIHRLRGLLSGVDQADSSFSVYLRPFCAALEGQADSYGTLPVRTGPETLYDLNGDTYQGQEGLKAMADLDPLSAIVAVGDLKFNPLRFEAAEVYAGTSVPWGTYDIATGSVVARQGNRLTLKGAALIRSDGTMVFHDRLMVQLGDGTRVTRQLSQENFTIDDISVGQRVTVFGVLTDTDPASLALDATAGRVQMLITTVRGTVANLDEADPTARMTIALQSINQFKVDIFDFSGTGADPADYQINTSTLDLSALAVASPVKLRGFVQPFGAAPPDFNAQTIIAVQALRAFMRVQWQAANAHAFGSISASGLSLNLEGEGSPPHHLARGCVLTDLTASEQPPVVAPQTDGNGLYILRAGAVAQTFLTFDDFIGGLQSRLAGTWRVRKISATGLFDDATATLTADMVDVQLQ